MKKLALAFALTFAFTLPFTCQSMADPRYEAKVNTTAFQHSFGRGNKRCAINKGQTVVRNWGKNWKYWIYARVRTGLHSDWTQGQIVCHGWIDKRDFFSLD